MNHSVKTQAVMVDNITSHNNVNHPSVKPQIVMGNNINIIVTGDIVDHYCFMFDTGVVHIVVAGYIVDHYYFIFDI
jgi:hypothetical protein